MTLTDSYVNPLHTRNKHSVTVQRAAVVHQSWVDPVAIDDNGYLTSTTPPSSATTETPTLAGAYVTGGVGTCPDGNARSVIVTVTADTAIIAMNGTITGTDVFGNVITAAWSVTASGTSKTSETAKAFKTVTGFSVTVAEDASGDNHAIIVGTGDILGLEAVNELVVPLSELEDGSAPTAGVLVAGVANDAAADAWGTYDPNSALDGSLDFDLWYITNDINLANAPAQRGQ